MKRITIIAGHYGSGKTNIAINYALMLKKIKCSVLLVDLDIVNPYFRAADSKMLLNEHEIDVICSDYVNSNVDFPAIPSSIYSIIDNKDKHVVIDLGGDDRGAYALGRYKDSILEEDNYQMLWVINKYRPLTSSEDDTLDIQKSIEKAAGLKFTGIVNNSNLGKETTADDIVNSYDYATNISEVTGLPIKYTTVADFVGCKNIKIFRTNSEDMLKIKLQDYEI